MPRIFFSRGQAVENQVRADAASIVKQLKYSRNLHEARSGCAQPLWRASNKAGFLTLWEPGRRVTRTRNGGPG